MPAALARYKNYDKSEGDARTMDKRLHIEIVVSLLTRAAGYQNQACAIIWPLVAREEFIHSG